MFILLILANILVAGLDYNNDDNNFDNPDQQILIPNPQDSPYYHAPWIIN